MGLLPCMCIISLTHHRTTGVTVMTMNGPAVTEESLTRDHVTTTCSGDTRAETRLGDTTRLAPKDASRPSPNAVFNYLL
jgi:hypothetical protein